MDINEIEATALFRYDLIHPIIAEVFPDANKKAYMERIARTERLLPSGKRGYVRVGTLREWSTNYRKQGLKGLKPKGRKDAGASRRLTHLQKAEIKRLKQENYRRPATVIRKRMLMTGYFPTGAPSVSTFQRYIAHELPQLKHNQVEDMRAFEMAHVNDLWQIDTTHGPFIIAGGRKRKVYIVGVIDDASRYLVGWGLFFEDNAINVQITLKRAIQTYGRPRRLYADNGKPYVNKQLALTCAELGVGIRHTQVYHGNQKGKIERWFGVMKQQWMADINYNQFASLDELKQAFAIYVRDRNNQANRNLPNDMTPMDRLCEEPDAIHKVEQTKLDIAFLHREERRVANDGTISLNGQQYETGRATIGQRVTVRYQPDLSTVWIEWDDQLLPIKLVDKLENGHTARERIRMTED